MEQSSRFPTARPRGVWRRQQAEQKHSTENTGEVEGWFVMLTEGDFSRQKSAMKPWTDKTQKKKKEDTQVALQNHTIIKRVGKVERRSGKLKRVQE
jgi:hypothetical protein